jgi:hypothetical protein
LPIALPQLTGAHTSNAIAAAVVATLKAYRIDSANLSYFVLNNAGNNNTTVKAISRKYSSFSASQRRLRCSPHTINLIRQALLFGKDKDAYNNNVEHAQDKEVFMQQWRKEGALGTLLAVIAYIKTPQQYELFASCVQRSNNNLPTAACTKILRPIKPVVTRWNSYHNALKQATQLKGGFDLYIKHHVSRVAYEDRRRNNTNTNAPA